MKMFPTNASLEQKHPNPLNENATILLPYSAGHREININDQGGKIVKTFTANESYLSMPLNWMGSALVIRKYC